MEKVSSLCLFHIFIFVLFYVSCYGQEGLQYSINEELPADTYIGNVGKDSNLRATASAEDFSQISYSFLSQGAAYEHYFSVNTQNGSIYTDVVIDRESITDCVYETHCVLSLSVVAKSKISAFFRTLKVSITIIDINDHSPTFPKQSTELDISELATVDSSLAIVGAVDADSANFSLQRYYILNEEQLDLPFRTSFEKYVDGSSVVKLVITGDLDRELQDTYSLVIVAEDGGDPKLTGTIAVNIKIDDSNDNSPNFTQSSYNVTVNETVEIGAQIVQLTAVDADIGINSEIVYTLSKNQIAKIHEIFAIDEATGLLTVKQKFESGGQYRVIVEASDKGLQPLMSQTVVTVTIIDSNNNRPEININLFSESDIASVSEYADIGTVVAHIALIDKDTGINGLITCEISSDKDVFGLQPLEVNAYKVTVAKGLDRESFDYIYVTVNCFDKGSPPLNSFAEFTVQVIDENDNMPSFLQEIYIVDIRENNEVNTDVVQVSAIDNDIGKNGEISYSVVATGDYRFSMDASSGIIKTMSVFNREKDDRLTFYVYAKDNGSPPQTSTATVVINVVDENDNDPKFSQPLYEFTVSENQPRGTSVGVITTSDDDAGNNAKLALAFDKTQPFTIDASGELHTSKMLDREDKPMYNFMVIVYDHGVPSRNASATVVVYVKDENDHDPQFIFPDSANHTVEVEAETEPKAVIAKIRAFDLDVGLNGELFYFIQNTNVSDLFAIDGYTGEITLVRPFLTTDQEIYYIMLRVDDNGNPRKFATTSMGIFITRKELPAKITETNGENLLIAITLGTVTFVLVFTIVLVICILKRRGNGNKSSSDSEDRFCEKDRSGSEKRVKFAEIASGSKGTSSCVTKAPVLESMATFSSDVNESRDSDMTSSTVDMETPILDRTKAVSSECSAVAMSALDSLSPSDSIDARHSTPRSDTQLSTLQSHNALLHSTIKPHLSFSTFGIEDNHSQGSGETTASDSGRGGSESDIHSASLSHSHDSDTRATEFRNQRHPVHHSTFADTKKPWMNLADLQHINCKKIPVAQQLHNDKKHRLQFRNFADKNSLKKTNDRHVHRVPCTQSHTKFDRSKFVTFQEPSIFPPPSSDHDRSFMTYDEEDDDLSTTTSGSYTIDHEDVMLDMRSQDMAAPGLRGCLV